MVCRINPALPWPPNAEFIRQTLTHVHRTLYSQEDAGRQVNARALDLLDELGPQARGPYPSGYPAAPIDPFLPELEDVLQGDDLALHAHHLGHVGYAAAAILQAVQVDDQVEGRGHLVPDRLHRQLKPGHEHHVLDAG